MLLLQSVSKAHRHTIRDDVHCARKTYPLTPGLAKLKPTPLIPWSTPSIMSSTSGLLIMVVGGVTGAVSTLMFQLGDSASTTVDELADVSDGMIPPFEPFTGAWERAISCVVTETLRGE